MDSILTLSQKIRFFQFSWGKARFYSVSSLKYYNKVQINGVRANKFIDVNEGEIFMVNCWIQKKSTPVLLHPLNRAHIFFWKEIVFKDFCIILLYMFYHNALNSMCGNSVYIINCNILLCLSKLNLITADSIP